MKKVTISIALFLGIFLSNLTFAADATGLWDYSETAGSHSNSCEAPQPSSDSLIGIVQTGDSFLIVNLDAGFSTFGSISSATYNFSDSFCEEGGARPQMRDSLSPLLPPVLQATYRGLGLGPGDPALEGTNSL